MKRKKNDGGRWPLVDRLESRSYLSASFSGPTFVTGVDNITGIATGDLAGKGVSDIVVAGQSPGTTNSVVGVFLSKSGTFGTPTIIPLNGTTGGVAIGDFLGNGHQDVAAINATTATIDVFLNDGAGNLSQGVGAGIGGMGGETQLVAADFNHDGKVDLAAVEPNDNTVGTFTSVGDNLGRFVGGANISIASPKKVAVGDFNHDGFPDLAIISSANPNAIYVALNDTHGGFGAPIPYSIGNNLHAVNDVAVADFNGDSLPDLVGIGVQSGTNAGVASVLLNLGGGIFGAATPLTVSAGAILGATGAFNGSGHQDIASISSTGALDVLPGDGTGAFGQDQQVFTTQLGAPGSQAVIGNFAGDGRPGIAFISSSPSGFGVLLNTTGGTITPPPPFTGTPSPLTPKLVGTLPTAPVVAGVKLKPIHQKVVLTNTGSSAINGLVTVSLLLSTTTAGSGGDPSVASVTIRRLVLKSHHSKTVLLTIRSLPVSANGHYYLVALVTDPAKLQNAAASATTLSAVPATVDLSAALTLLPTSVRLNHPTTLAFTVTNSGTVPTVGRLEYKVYLSANGLVDGAITIADVTRGRAPIRPGKPVKIRLNRTIRQIPAGNYFFILQLDPKNVFHDLTPGNNTIVSPQPPIAVS